MNSKTKNQRAVDEPTALFLSKNKQNLSTAIQLLHQKHCSEQKDFYLDPQTGYQVMTAYYLEKRGYCCQNKCRHCPY